MFKWVRSQWLYHFVEPYHAPYVSKHRYWTGLLLFIRIALYLTFALNVLGDPGVNLFAVIVFIACIFFLKGCYGEIYKKSAVDKIEMICYLNLGIFSATQLYLLEGGNQKAIDASACISGIVTLVLLLVVMFYHVHSEFCCKRFMKWKHREVTNDKSDIANSESIGQSLVKATCSIVERPKWDDKEIQYQRFSEQSNLLHHTNYDLVLSKQYGATF